MLAGAARNQSLVKTSIDSCIDLQFHWIREAVSMKQLSIVYILTAEMAANGFTKGLPAPGSSEFCRMIGVSTGS